MLHLFYSVTEFYLTGGGVVVGGRRGIAGLMGHLARGGCRRGMCPFRAKHGEPKHKFMLVFPKSCPSNLHEFQSRGWWEDTLLGFIQVNPCVSMLHRLSTFIRSMHMLLYHSYCIMLQCLMLSIEVDWTFYVNRDQHYVS